MGEITDEQLATWQRLADGPGIADDRETVTALVTEVRRLRDAMTKISAIRDSIVGCQGFNFSEHAYPLVAVLDGAGFKGAGYEIAHKNLGTAIDQRDAAIARAEAAEQRLAAVDRCVASALGVEGQDVLAMEGAAWMLRGERDGYRAKAEELQAELDRRGREANELEAQVERMRPVVDAATTWRRATSIRAIESGLALLTGAVDAYHARKVGS